MADKISLEVATPSRLVIAEQVDEVVGAVAALERERHHAAGGGEVVQRDEAAVVVRTLVRQHVAVRLVEELEPGPPELG